MNIKTMNQLVAAIERAIEIGVPISLSIQMPGFPSPEVITNPVENLHGKLAYYKSAYDDELEHKHSKGIKIIAYSL